MAAAPLILSGLVRKSIFKPLFRNASQSCKIRELIGNREIVGYGHNGQPHYSDMPCFPMPAIRWREPNSEICALQEKEKGDWHDLSVEDKKKLYRYSFCQTYAEFQAPSGEWKSVIGVGMALMALSFWMFYYYKALVYGPLPISFDEEHRAAQFRRLIDMRNAPINGLASKWDYDKDDWKK